MYKLSFAKNTNRFTEKELLDNIGNVWDFLQRQPTIRDIENYPSKIYSFQTYFNRFGSWKKALDKFCLYKEGKIIIKEEQKKRSARKYINDSFRFKILKRDNFKCVCCGKSPANDSNIELEIDHIIPISKGGDNSIENLRTLCKQCNIGKFNNK